MSEGMLTGLKHSHTLFVTIFILGFLYKAILLFADKTAALERFRAKTKVFLDMIVPTLFIALGVAMLTAFPKGMIPTWIWLKIALMVVAIPLGIVGIKKGNKALVALTCLIFIGLFVMAYVKPAL